MKALNSILTLVFAVSIFIPITHAAYTDPVRNPGDLEFFYSDLEKIKKTTEERRYDVNYRRPNQYPTACEDPALVASHHFDERETLSLADETSLGNTLMLHSGAALAPGKFGTALQFDRTLNSYASMGPSKSLSMREDLTIEFWFRQEKKEGVSQALVTRAGSKDHPYDFYLGITDRNKLMFSIKNSGVRLVSEDEVPVGEWVHIAATYRSWQGQFDSSDTRMVLYMNGLTKGRLTLFPQNLPTGEAEVVLGALKIGNSTYDHLTGRMEELKIYNEELQREDVNRRMDKGAIYCERDNGEVTDIAEFACIPTADTELSCTDGVDNDCDGKTDTEDTDCTMLNLCTDREELLVMHFNTPDIGANVSPYVYNIASHSLSAKQGYYGTALNLDGNSFVEIENSNDLILDSDMTLQFWYYRPINVTGHFSLVSHYDPITQKGFSVHINPQGNIEYIVNSKISVARSSRALERGQWSHVLVTYDTTDRITEYEPRTSDIRYNYATQGKLRIYINGLEAGRSNIFEQPVKHPNTPLYIGVGMEGRALNYHAYGRIDELKLSTRFTERDRAMEQFSRTEEFCGAYLTPAPAEEALPEDVLTTEEYLPSLEIELYGSQIPEETKSYVEILNRGRVYGGKQVNERKWTGSTNVAFRGTNVYSGRYTDYAWNKLQRDRYGQGEEPYQMVIDPTGRVTKARLIGYIYELLDLEREAYTTSSFSDVLTSHSHFQYLEDAFQKGLISVDSNQVIKPDSPISEREAVKILLEVARQHVYPSDAPNFESWLMEQRASYQDYISQYLVPRDTLRLTRNLRFASADPEVRTLKTILSELGYYNGPINYNYDITLKTALYDMQFDQGLVTDPNTTFAGILNTETRRVVNELAEGLGTIYEIRAGRDTTYNNLPLSKGKLVELLVELLIKDRSKPYAPTEVGVQL